MLLMEAAGDSMSPEIKDGDTVLIDQSQRIIFVGKKISAVSIGQEVMVRYLDRASKKFVLHGTNHSCHDIEIGVHENSREPVTSSEE